MPSSSAGQPDADRKARALSFSHDQEVARPYAYSVGFRVVYSDSDGDAAPVEAGS